MTIVNNNILVYQNHKENRFSTKTSSVCEVIFKLAWCDNSWINTYYWGSRSGRFTKRAEIKLPFRNELHSQRGQGRFAFSQNLKRRFTTEGQLMLTQRDTLFSMGKIPYKSPKQRATLVFLSCGGHTCYSMWLNSCNISPVAYVLSTQ